MTPAVSCAIIAGIWVAFFQTIVRTVASDEGLVLLPPWKPSWNMSLSTVIQPCNASGMFDTAFGSRFGIVDFDFENAWKQWSNEKPMDAETLMVEAAVSNQRANPESRSFVYRDLLKARSFFKKTREKLDAPAYSGWFLQFDPKLKGHYHTADCDHNFEPPKCSKYYHDQTNTPQMDVPHNVTPFGPHAKGPPRGYPCIEPCDCGVQPCGECE